jgi:hypothetical protein
MDPLCANPGMLTACLSVVMYLGETVVLQPYYPGNTNQQWMRADPFIQSRVQPNRVLDVAGLFIAIG